MLRTYVTHARVVQFEPALADYLRSDETDHSTTIASAKEILTQDLRSNRLELKRLCTPLSLQASTSETTSNTGDKSDEDSCTAVGGTEVFTLQGTNDDASETWTTIDTLTFTDTGDDNLIFDDVYRFYRVNYSGTSATYSSDLYEESFYLAHIYKSLEMIFNKLKSNAGDNWETQRDFYVMQYGTMMNNIIHTYDKNLDGNISLGEEDEQLRPSFTR